MQRITCTFAASLAMGLILSGATPTIAADGASPPPAQDAAAEVDRLLEAAFPADVEPAPLTTDEDFLRRVSLDLAGTIPSPNDVTLFGLDPNPAKRAELIDRLLDSPGYGDVWAAYWTDVIFSRATDQRSRIAQPVFAEWMRQQLNDNTPWDEVATELITATGNVQEDGRTALVFAHQGDATELASETSRIFLGIQIQCANCHDHPSDSWTRQQFHELAAFFPRISVQRIPGDNNARGFEVVSVNPPPARFRPGGGPDKGQFSLEEQFQALDRNRDGRLVPAELQRNRVLAGRFERLDRNNDGALTLQELQPPMNQPGRASPEYYMPDLNDPSSRGTLVEPVFFIDETSLETGTTDQARRHALAEHMTSPENEWFSKAFVNRIWAEMTGSGFHMPIDDMGPLRTARHPEVLDFLAGQFAAHDYDVKWLYRAIASTDAYQREIRTLEPGAEAEAFASAAPTRLRSDQVYNALTEVLGPQQTGFSGRGQGPGGNPGRDFGRVAFSQLFGFDPSTPQEDIVGSIPQALYLMNSPQLNNQLRGVGNTRLARILGEFDDDRDALAELYLVVLAREPSDRELEINQEYIDEVGSRAEAFEDIMWSLLNSSEFLSKR